MVAEIFPLALAQISSSNTPHRVDFTCKKVDFSCIMHFFPTCAIRYFQKEKVDFSCKKVDFSCTRYFFAKPLYSGGVYRAEKIGKNFLIFRSVAYFCKDSVTLLSYHLKCYAA